MSIVREKYIAFSPEELDTQLRACYLEEMGEVEESGATVFPDCSFSPPAEVMAAVEHSALAPVPKYILKYLAQHWQTSVSAGEIIQNGWGLNLDENWKNLWPNVNRLRQGLPEHLAVYNIRGTGCYILDWRRPVGSWFVPRDRAEVVGRMPHDIVPLLRFCNEVEVKDSQWLRSRLKQKELAIVSALGEAYPDLVGSDELIQAVWSHEQADIGLKESLWVHICRLKDKIQEFPDGRFDIVNAFGVGYSLYRVS